MKDEFDMGEKVRVGALTYNVLDAQWKSQLGAFPIQRFPQSNFLLVRISVTNGGGGQQVVPGLQLENSRGDSYPEITDGKGVENWLGVIRQLPPAGTEEGWVLFDLPTNSYRLRLEDPESETNKVSYIRIPLRLEAQ